MKFLDLPTELVHYIVKFLPAESLSRLSQTCKQLNEVADSDSLWQGLSYREYKIGSNKGWNISYKVMYTKILRPWHKFLGLKRIELVPYGGLVNVCWAEGEIQVIRYHSKPGDMAFSKLSRVPLFSLRWNETVPCIEVVCVQCSYERPAVLSQERWWYGVDDSRFRGRCDDHHAIFKWLNIDKRFDYPLAPLLMPSEADQARSPVQLGLYTGDYGSHGVEIINLMFNKKNLKFWRGDFNVPAGYISMTVYLYKPIVLSARDQTSVPGLMLADEQRTAESFTELLNVSSTNSDVLRQPFVMPEGILDGDRDVPSYCLARYIGLGRIAEPFYSSPNHCTCHFIKFSDVKFGVMWVELSSFSMFYKVQEDFPRSLV